jgi:hypothetical protein
LERIDSMTTKNLVNLLLFHFFTITIGTILFVLSFRTRLFLSMNVLFYRGILLLITACIVVTLILLFIKISNRFNLLTYRDIILGITIIFSFNLLFFTHFPVTSERSISLFMLGYMNKNVDKAFTKEEITQVFIEKYIIEYGEIEKRFHEQMVTGDIVSAGKGYRITKRGQSILKFFNFVDDLFLIDKKIISPY